MKHAHPWTPLALVLLSACGNSASIAPNDVSDSGDASLPAKTDAGIVAITPDAAPAPLFGANVTGSGVEFRVWAPNATAAWVVGNFADAPVPMMPSNGGTYELHAANAHAGALYHFRFVSPAGTIDRTDPYCRELHGADCAVIDPSYAWKTSPFVRPSRAASVVYEMHIGSFAVPSGSAQGTFATAQARLADLAALGINVIELMPVTHFGGNPNGWGYNPQLYFAPKPSYGTADELRSFVDEAHRLGIAVWLDIVANHTDGWDQAPLYCFDGLCPSGTAGIYFFPDSKYGSTPWGPRPDFTQPQVVRMLLSSAETWMNEFHGDGFRWDSTSNIRGIDGQGTTPGGRELLQEANSRTHALGGFSVAEDLKGWDALTQPTSMGGFGFDAQWDGFGYDVMNFLANGNDDARDLSTLVHALTATYAGDPFARLLFVENHDTVGNGGARLPVRIDSANPASFAARRRSMLGAVMLLTSPGVPMLFMGQESLASTGFTDPPAPLSAPSAAGQNVRAFYTDLIHLRRNLDGGAGGLLGVNVEITHRNDDAKVLAFRRSGTNSDDVFVVLNLRNRGYAQYDVGMPDAGPWRVRLSTDRKTYGDDFPVGTTGPITAVAQTRDGKPYTLSLSLGAYGAVVLTH